MNVLFVNNFMNRGGGEEFLRDLLPGLVSRGINVGLICRPGTPLTEMFKNSAVALYPVHNTSAKRISAVLKTARIIRQGRYDIVNIQRGHDIVQSWLGALVSGQRPALIYTPQVPEFLKSRFLLSRMTNIITISRYIRDKIIAFSPELTSRTTIIYYGIDLDRFRGAGGARGRLRSRFNLLPEMPLIGTVGDLWKNQVEFLEALKIIRIDFPDARFALVASGADSEHLRSFKQRAQELGLSEALIWTGRLSKEEMLSFYADIDVAVSTHRNEGFGIWVLEAMAAGTPVVSVKEGGIRDSLEACPAGILVNGGPREMAQQVIALLKNSALKRSTGEAGPAWVSDRFSRERMILDYCRFFEGQQKAQGIAQKAVGGR